MWFRGLDGYGQAYPTRPGGMFSSEWQIKAVGEFSADGRADIPWQQTKGTVCVWKMNGGSCIGESPFPPHGPTWQLSGYSPMRMDDLICSNGRTGLI